MVQHIVKPIGHAKPVVLLYVCAMDLLYQKFDAKSDNRFRVCEIENTPMVAVFDVFCIIGDCKNPRDSYFRICKKYPEIKKRVIYHKFPGKGQNETPVMPILHALEIMTLLPNSDTANRFRLAGIAALRSIVKSNKLDHFMEQDVDFKSTIDEFYISLMEMDQTKTYMTSRNYRKQTSVYVRVRCTDHQVEETSNPKALTNSIIKFGITHCLEIRDKMYNYPKSDNGYMLFSFDYNSRAEAECIENILKIDYGKITVLGSREYLDAKKLSEAIQFKEYSENDYQSYTKLAEQLFNKIVNITKYLWGDKYSNEGFIHPLEEMEGKGKIPYRISEDSV
jgi:hypothetical protein